jgi:hypothetical protein
MKGKTEMDTRQKLALKINKALKSIPHGYDGGTVVNDIVDLVVEIAVEVVEERLTAPDHAVLHVGMGAALIGQQLYSEDNE